MSRRSATKLTVQLQFQLPPGATVNAALEYIRRALFEYKTSAKLSDPISALNVDSVQIKLQKRETTYL